MRRHSLRLIVAMLVAGVVAFTQTGCKEDTLIDAKVVPRLNVVNVDHLDSFTVYAKTVYDDSAVFTSYSIAGLSIYHALGTIKGPGFADPFFGGTNAAIYMQIVPQTTSPTIFDGTHQIDSTILIIPYNSDKFIYGDITGPDQVVNVYPLLDTMQVGTNYPDTALNKRYDVTRVYGSGTIRPGLLLDSPFMYGKKRPPCLRIKLGSNFYDDLTAATINHGTNFPDFLNNFRGLYIGPGPDSNQNGSTLPYYQLDGTDTFSHAGVLVYYHTAPSDSAQVFQFPFNTSYCAHYNYITRNYSGTPAAKYINSTATQTDSLVLVQNQPGAAIDIRIPFLKNLQSQMPKMVINKAELIITAVNTNTSNIFAMPAKLYASRMDPDGKKRDIADRDPKGSLSPLPFINGYQQPVSINGANTVRYIINMPREVINTLFRQSELHLRINGTQDYFGAYRLVAAGSGPTVDTNYRIKLNIVYSTSKSN